jgi:hypothetical protein
MVISPELAQDKETPRCARFSPDISPTKSDKQRTTCRLTAVSISQSLRTTKPCRLHKTKSVWNLRNKRKSSLTPWAFTTRQQLKKQAG